MARPSAYYGTSDYVEPPLGSGFAEALSERLAQGGGRTTNPHSRRAGGRYTQGRKTRGKTMSQVVQDAKRDWVSAPESVKQKYRDRAAALGDPSPAATPAGAAGSMVPAPVTPPMPLPAPAGGAGSAVPAATGVMPTVSPDMERKVRDFVAPPAAAVPAPVPAPAPAPTAATARAVAPPVASPVGAAMNMAQGVANAVTPVGAAAQPSSVTPQTGSIGGIPTQDEIYLGDTPVGEGWTLVGSLRGQKKWARGADMSALNAGAAAQTAANQAIPGTTVNPRATPGAGRGTPIKTSPVTPPAPAQSYRSLGPGQGVAPTAKVVPEPPMTYGEYDQARTALKQTIEPGSPEARATFGRMKDFEDKAAEEQATVERRKRLMLPPA